MRVEHEMRGVLALCPFWQGGGWRSGDAQIEQDFLLNGAVLLLAMDIVRRGKVWGQIRNLGCRLHG